jgi:hypothetical protein
MSILINYITLFEKNKMSCLKISGKIGDFTIEVDPKYFRDKIKNNATTLYLFQSFGGSMIKESKYILIFQ